MLQDEHVFGEFHLCIDYFVAEFVSGDVGAAAGVSGAPMLCTAQPTQTPWSAWTVQVVRPHNALPYSMRTVDYQFLDVGDDDAGGDAFHQCGRV